MKIIDNPAYNFGIISLLIVSAIMVVFGIGLFFMWIYHSWINRNNSANYTGRDITEKLFTKNNLDYEIQSSFFYVKYWNHNKKRNTYKLRPWTHNRRSVWTLMEASQQAYATIIRKTNKKKFWLVFRLPQFVSLISTILGIAIMSWAILGVTNTNDILKFETNISKTVYIKLILGALIFITGVTYAIVARAYVLRKNVPPMLEGIGLSNKEIKIIKRIFTWALLYSISLAIVETIKTVLRIANYFSDSPSIFL